ncbi:MAG: hydantoinase/oxoprolinase [Candidatus Eremiobacteraeota bacterium]|nr:hydantoinase/oxoprolinase [Candidatus Eremiobacteraeota bacterium]
MARKLRLGVDVGGTFTDVVAIDAATRELIAKIKVPTTHDAPSGVAAGIIAGIERLLAESGVAPEDVAFIAHSTTQATNALLEGDVASVGVVGMTQRGGWFARSQMHFRPVTLAPGVEFAPRFAFVAGRNGRAIDEAVDSLAREGVEVIAASEAFGVDAPDREARVMNVARERGLFATSGHDVSSMYGLRARTRTAALNAAILPKMVRTATMTAQAVERATISAPLMIMRSDGGVMDVREIERRPILTMLSGPAAGVAGALLYENVTDGIFLEVGGTSVDASAIRAGQPQMRPARVGGHRTMLRTIDSRTLGVAGGSMPRMSAHALVDVGPRSAHIAGCSYATFLPDGAFEGARIERFAPTPHDPPDYVRFVLADGSFATVTPTCASNVLGYVPDDAFARGNALAARAAFELLARACDSTAEVIARRMLELAAAKVLPLIDELVADYELPRDRLVLIGGGGGAAAIVPFVAQAGGFRHRIARDADVISPIGVALALVRDVVERTIVDPTPDDIVRIRREAADRVITSGASPERIEVSVEIDTQRNRVRATASGATAMVEAAGHGTYDLEQRRAAAAHAMGVDAGTVHSVECTPLLDAFVSGHDLRIVDERAVVRLALRDATLHRTTAGALENALREAVEAATSFGDVGRALPELFLIHGGKIADFSGLANVGQAVSLAKEETSGRAHDDPIMIVTVARAA